MNLKLSALSFAIITSLSHVVSAYTDLGSGTYYWSIIKNQDNSFLIDNGTLWLDEGPSGYIGSSYSFLVGEDGAYFQTNYAWTFEGVVFSTQNLRGGMSISTTGSNMYLTSCTIDIGSVLLSGNGSNYIVFDSSSISLGLNEQISDNSSLSLLIFREGSLILDLDSYVQATNGAVSGNWNLISGSSINWSNMTIGSASDSFEKDSETSYHYTDTNGHWLVNVDGQDVTLSYSSLIPEPSHFTFLFSGFTFALMACRRRK